MANEIAISASLSANKGGAAVASGTVSKNVNLAGSNMASATQLITTGAWTALALDAVSDPPGLVLIENLDGANFVKVALDNAGTNKTGIIRPGLPMLWQPYDANKIFLEADTANVLIQRTVIDL